MSEEADKLSPKTKKPKQSSNQPNYPSLPEPEFNLLLEKPQYDPDIPINSAGVKTSKKRKFEDRTPTPTTDRESLKMNYQSITENYADSTTAETEAQNERVIVEPKKIIGEADLTSKISGVRLQNRTCESEIMKLILIENDTKYLTCSADSYIRVFDAQKHKLLKSLQADTPYVLDVIMLRDGQLASCGDRTIQVWNLLKGNCTKILEGHFAFVTAIVEAPNSVLISGSFDKSVKLWNLNDSGSVCKPFKTVLDEEQSHVGLHSLCLIDDNTFAVGSGRYINMYYIPVWPSFDVTVKAILRGHKSTVRTLQLTMNKDILISVSHDETCKVWKVITGECLQTFMDHTSDLFAVALLSETLLVTGAKEIKFWDLESGVCLKTLEQGQKHVRHLAITKDMRLFSCGNDGKVWIHKI